MTTTTLNFAVIAHRQKQYQERGQVLFESLLVLPVFLFFIAAILILCGWIYTRETVETLCYEALICESRYLDKKSSACFSELQRQIQKHFTFMHIKKIHLSAQGGIYQIQISLLGPWKTQWTYQDRIQKPAADLH